MPEPDPTRTPGYQRAEQRTLDRAHAFASRTWPLLARDMLSPRDSAQSLHDPLLGLALVRMPLRDWHAAMGRIRPPWYHVPKQIAFYLAVRVAKRQIRQAIDRELWGYARRRR